ncbi:hypothetical protein IT417_00145 [bacterium]|nr:hypothetical protein [bacterium]
MQEILFKKQKNESSTLQSASGFSYFINLLILIGFIVFSIFLLFNSFRSIQIAKDKMAILNRAREEVTDLRLKNISLILDKTRIETDDYTETDIRNRLNYSKRGEVIFVLSDQSLNLAKKELENILKLGVAKISEKKSVSETWKDFFIYGM